MDALLVVDMQEEILKGDSKHDLSAVVGRINGLTARVRQRGGSVFFIQHDGAPGDDFAPFAPGWAILGSITREPGDHIVRKRLNSAFFGTTLRADLAQLGVDRVFVTGWATDLCVDGTVRAAAELGLRVVVVSDGHTVSDRPHLSAPQVIAHHHWVWTNLFAPQPVMLVRECEL